jgi:hypothetical protein
LRTSSSIVPAPPPLEPLVAARLSIAFGAEGFGLHRFVASSGDVVAVWAVLGDGAVFCGFRLEPCRFPP